MRSEDGAIRIEKRGALELRLYKGTDPEEVMSALGSPGILIKESSTWRTKRVGPWVLKSTCKEGWGWIKHVFKPGRSGRAWRAALHLQGHGVHVPFPRALAIRRRFGIVTQSVMVSDFLDDAVNVEEWARRIASQEGAEAPEDFLRALAAAINALTKSGAYHADLSGKNILTEDGKIFYFIDLDVVDLDFAYDVSARMKNHVQLYDSFTDVWNDQVVESFIEDLTPKNFNRAAWIEKVREGQKARRRRQMALWRKQGKR